MQLLINQVIIKTLNTIWTHGRIETRNFFKKLFKNNFSILYIIRT